MGAIYLIVLKLRKEGYAPLFTAAKKEQRVLISIIQEAYINGVST